jgi:hypothetical protein
MSKMLFGVLALCVSAGCVSPGSTAEDSSAEYEPELVGGRRLQAGEAPGSIVFKTPDFVPGKSGRMCSGTVVAPRSFVTAAHCVFAEKTTTLVEAGETITYARILGRVDDAFRPGSRLLAGVGPTLAKVGWGGFRGVTIARASIVPELVAAARGSDLWFDVLLDRGLSDVAIVETVEDLAPWTGSVPIDPRPIENGEELEVVGFGCEDVRLATDGSLLLGAVDRITGEIGRLRTISHERVFEIVQRRAPDWRSWWPTARRDLAIANEAYVFAPGPQVERGGASLCPGDSGGGLHRTATRALVGVSSSFATLRAGRRSQYSSFARLHEAPTQEFLRAHLPPTSFR